MQKKNFEMKEISTILVLLYFIVEGYFDDTKDILFNVQKQKVKKATSSSEN